MVKLIDTNIIIRFITWTDKSWFEASKSIFEQIEAGSITVIINDVIIAESLYVLEWFYKYERKSSAIILKDMLLLDGVVNPDKLSLIQALQLYMDTSMDFTDCLLIAISNILHYEVITLDKQVQKYISRNL